MRKVATPSGPFPFQLYFEDLGEIDEICLEALKTQSLLPSRPALLKKNNDEYYADRKTFSWIPRGPTEADGGNSRRTKQSEVFCFLDC